MNLRLRPMHRWCSTRTLEVAASAHGFLVGPRSENAQDAFEYVLVIGTVAVALVVGMYGFNSLVRAFLENACASVDTAATTAGGCIG